jgi:hypothetical protein
MLENEKILISGTGRCGTTFLIKLFTLLDFDTGYDKSKFENYIDKKCNSGMERNFTSEHYIIKNPYFIKGINQIVDQIKIKYMIIPIRNFKECANSRMKNGDTTVAGGLIWGATNVEEQIKLFNETISNYIFYMTKHDINTIFIDFDKMINDYEYLFNKLNIILREKNITVDVFKICYDQSSETSKPKIINL